MAYRCSASRSAAVNKLPASIPKPVKCTPCKPTVARRRYECLIWATLVQIVCAATKTGRAVRLCAGRVAYSISHVVRSVFTCN